MVSIVGELYLDLRTATDQRLVVEVGLARAAVPEASLDAEALLARIERLERRLSIAGGEGPAPAASAPAVRPAGAEPAGKKAAAVTGTAVRPPGTPEPQPPVDGAPTGRVAARGAGSERLSTAPRAAGSKALPAGEAPAATDKAPAAAGKAPAVSGEARRAAGSRTPAATGKAPTSAEAPVEEAGWGAAEAPARVPVDLDLVRRSWPLVLERVQAASKVTASFLGHGRPVALEGRQLVVELPRDRRFEAEALVKNGRNQQVDGVLEAMLGGGLEIRVVVGEHAGPEDPDPPPVEAAAPAPDQVVEFEVDPANDEGRPLDADADARAVADWAAKELGGKVIEERPNDSGAKGGARGARKGR
jgi:DNA polymerase-3 subunit gamma/tau